MTSRITESDVERAAMDWLAGLGWRTAYGPDIAPGVVAAEREDYREAVLARRLRDALAALNPDLPAGALDDAFRRLTQPAGANLEARNREFHRMLAEGVPVEFRGKDGEARGGRARAVDFGDPDANHWLAVRQFTMTERAERRPDIVLFVNGLPLGLIELKNPADEDATLRSAWNQLRTYEHDLPSLLALNELLVVSDGAEARLGVLTAGFEWFRPWRTIGGREVEDEGAPQLRVLLEGVCERSRFLDLVRGFIAFEDDGGRLSKKVAGHHQFHAVRAAVRETLRAAGLRPGSAAEERGAHRTGAPADRAPGDRRIGVIWHTQGAGKSLTMAFFAGAIARESAMLDPTVVVLADRNDLDEQLFGTFARCAGVLSQGPEQAESRDDLRRLLGRGQGGVIFTTIQKFEADAGEISGRDNIVVIADEAHRSQYGFVDGLARRVRDALPNASFVGFTATPIELEHANTQAVFGDVVSEYDMRQSQDDGATVPIYYESRLADIALDEAERPVLDEEFEELTEAEEAEGREALKAKWSALRKIVGAPRRLDLVASDLVRHFGQRLEAMPGKAMAVCMSRAICVDLYAAIVRLRPEWEDGDDARGEVKVVMTGAASDPPEWREHIRDKARREALARRFRDAADPLRLVIVRDMWLTGFDAPSLHTMYVDKPMRGHALMQAIARVNRVHGDKRGGLVVDYIGIERELRRAVSLYTAGGRRPSPVPDRGEIVRRMTEHHEVCAAMLHGFDRSAWAAGAGDARLELLAAAQERVLALEDGRRRFADAARRLSLAYAVAVPGPEALAVRDDVGFFRALRAVLLKREGGGARAAEELDAELEQLVARAIAPEGVLDIFEAAGMERRDISILSDEFLADIRNSSRPNLAVDLLKKLLEDEIAGKWRRNVVRKRSFGEMLADAIGRYRDGVIGSAEVIEALIGIARELRAAEGRGERLGLGEDEAAFYDALAANDSAVAVLGEETLCGIARELIGAMRRDATADWTLRENVQAKLRAQVKRILSRYGYPPDGRADATRLVIEQTEALSAAWHGAG